MSDGLKEIASEPWSPLTASVMLTVDSALKLIERQLAQASDQDLVLFIMEWDEMDGWPLRDRRLAWLMRPRARREQKRRVGES